MYPNFGIPMRSSLFALAILIASLSAAAQATRPTTQPSTQPSGDQVLDDMLKPLPADRGRSVQTPPTGVAIDRTSGSGALAPNAPAVRVVREGTYIIDRIGRLARTPDGSQAEFAFESDGKGLKDPPMIILPNQKLAMMEGAVIQANRDLKFRATGMVTEYHGRNYILIEKVTVLSQEGQDF